MLLRKLQRPKEDFKNKRRKLGERERRHRWSLLCCTFFRFLAYLLLEMRLATFFAPAATVVSFRCILNPDVPLISHLSKVGRYI